MQPTLTRKLLCLAATLSALAACNGGGEGTRDEATKADSAAIARTEAIPFRVVAPPVLDCLPLYYAVEQGWFESYGIIDHHKGQKAEIIPISAQTDCDTAMTAGAGIVFVDSVYLSRINTRETRFAPILRTRTPWGIAAAAPLRLKQLKDLKDRVVAMARRTASEQIAYSALRSAGLQQPDAMYPQVGSFATAASMVLAAQVDAAVLPEPFFSVATAQGCKELYRTQQGTSAFLCTPKEKPLPAGKAEQLVQLYNRAADELNKGGRALTSPLLQRYAGMPAELADSLRLPTLSHAIAYGR